MWDNGVPVCLECADARDPNKRKPNDPAKKDEPFNGLTTYMLSKSIREECERAHREFLVKYALQHWSLVVTNIQDRPAITVASNPPDDAGHVTREIAVTLGFAKELVGFLDGQHAAWRTRLDKPG
jgi:hypothetical protein